MKFSNSCKKAIVSAVQAIIILLCSLLAVLPKTARAAVPTDNETTTNNLDKVYYYTDYSGYGALCTVIQNSGISDITVTYHDSEFSDNFIDDYIADEFDISDAYVIFEIRNGFSRQISYMLEDIFCNMKNNNCQIMFICGTEELRFAGYNSFLDYADIHINTDAFSTFLSSIFYRWQESCETPRVNDTTFILDMNLAAGLDGLDDSECWFLMNYFMPFIRHVYMEEIRVARHTNYRVLRDAHINILCHTSSGYLELVSGVYVNDYDDFDIIRESQRIIAVGTTWLGTNYSQEWLYETEDMLMAAGIQSSKVKIYMYGQNLFLLSSYYNMYICDDGIYSLQIPDDFLQNKNLGVYDNWGGRCIVTHKPIPQGSNGWMTDFDGTEESELADFWKAWQLSPDTETDEYETSDEYYYRHYDLSWGREDVY